MTEDYEPIDHINYDPALDEDTGHDADDDQGEDECDYGLGSDTDRDYCDERYASARYMK